MTATASQAWAILTRHARDEMALVRLQDLCRDNDRVSSLVAVYNGHTSTTENDDNDHQHPHRLLIVDLSRQRMALETLNHLLRLSVARGLKQYIRRLAWGQNDPDNPILPTTAAPHSTHRQSSYHAHQHYHYPYLHYSSMQQPTRSKQHRQQQQQPSNSTRFDHKHSDPQRQHSHSYHDDPHNATNTNTTRDHIPSMHLALRAPKDRGYHMMTRDGINALTSIHREWDRIERLSDCIRRGQWRGATGSMIRTVVVVGKGVPIQALKFVSQALCHDETGMVSTRVGLEEDPYSTTTTGRLIRQGLAVAAASSGRSGTSAPSSQTHRVRRRLLFLSSFDPLAAAQIMAELDPASTLVISFALQGNEDTGIATRTMKTWLLQQLAGGTTGGGGSSSKKADQVLSKHMLLVTGNDRIATSINKPESVFVIPEHSRCEAFTSFTAATLLPLSIVFGWSLVEQFLAGAHDMDSHFVETNPRHNLPVLLALTDVWNDAFLGATGRVVTPYTGAMGAFPSFVAALESQTCGNATVPNTNHHSGSNSSHGANDSGHHYHHHVANSNNHNHNNHRHHGKAKCSSIVLDGGMDSAYDRSIYQGATVLNSELVMVMNPQLKANTARVMGDKNLEDIHTNADALMCSMFSHADEMAFGSGDNAHGSNHNIYGSSHHQRPPPYHHPYVDNAPCFDGDEPWPDGDHGPRPNSTSTVSEGNRPSTVLLCGTCDAFTCGQLVALSEHRAIVKARIWDLDPFAREFGSALKTKRTEQLRDELKKLYEADPNNGEDPTPEEDGDLNLSTKTILGHYANLTKEVYAVESR